IVPQHFGLINKRKCVMILSEVGVKMKKKMGLKGQV
ncbi:hypothetical protein HKBW3C_02609, partial [Candidatus Hakubella thermalkaliphila]